LSILDVGNDHTVILVIYVVSSSKVVFDGLAVKNGNDGGCGGSYLRYQLFDEIWFIVFSFIKMNLNYNNLLIVIY